MTEQREKKSWYEYEYNPLFHILRPLHDKRMKRLNQKCLLITQNSKMGAPIMNDLLPPLPPLEVSENSEISEDDALSVGAILRNPESGDELIIASIAFLAHKRGLTPHVMMIGVYGELLEDWPANVVLREEVLKYIQSRESIFHTEVIHLQDDEYQIAVYKRIVHTTDENV